METKQNSRRGFFKVAAGVAATAVAAPVLLASEKPQSTNGAYLEYAKKKVGSLAALKSSGTLDFSYPDADSPCQAVYVNGKIKAYSILCTHKGCPLMYNASNNTFVCPCHFSKFDAQKDGQMIIGQATSELPQVFVKVEGDSIIAYGIDGLVFGRESNKLG